MIEEPTVYLSALLLCILIIMQAIVYCSAYILFMCIVCIRSDAYELRMAGILKSSATLDAILLVVSLQPANTVTHSTAASNKEMNFFIFRISLIMWSAVIFSHFPGFVK